MPSSTVRLIALLAASVLAVPVAYAQSVRLPADDVGVFRDTLQTDVPQPYVLRPFLLAGTETVQLDGVPLDSTSYRLDHRHGRLWLEVDSVSSGSTLVVAYRTLPFQFEDVYRRRHLTRTDSAESKVVQEERQSSQAPFHLAGTALRHSGSISRGILAGNRQDATLESGLRMELSGEVAQGVNVQAVLTDENTPILPEGTTQRLEEFDRVFIELDAPMGKAQLGDFDFELAGTEFARFSRKLQGVSLSSDMADGGAPFFTGGRIAAAGAVSRGTFRQQRIEPLDGVQGPYRLEGQTGERFILVVPGSEVVYLDGRRLTRGETQDYVIDYATAEIHFTTHRLVTADQRIVVEFQYTSNQFTRTLVGSQAEVALGQNSRGARGRFGATFLREADGRQFADEFGLTDADSLLLVSGGDDEVLQDGAVPVPFDPEARHAQYRREERVLADGRSDTVYVALNAAPMGGEQVYRVRFSRVGEGRGRYRREGQAVNGIVYVYEGPGGGAYEPVRLLPKPKQQRLLDLHGAFQVVQGLEVFGEWARSLHDENRLSPLDAGDDVGDAFLGGLRLQPASIGVVGISLGKLSGELRRRHTGANFKSFDRIREVEFDRRWNLTAREIDPTSGVAGGGGETIDEGFILLEMSGTSSVRGDLGRIRLEGAFEGRRRSAAIRVAEAGLPDLDYHVEHVASRDALLGVDGSWLRQHGELRGAALGGSLVPRLEVEQERRREVDRGTGELAPRSLSYVEMRPGIDWVAENLEAGGSAELRKEDLWSQGVLREGSTAWTAQTHLRYRPGGSFDADANVGYRLRRYTEHFRVEEGLENNESLLLKWHSRARPWQRALDIDARYEALTERTPRLQEIYVRTGPELGQFVWEDANDNGIIEIEEMVPERMPHEGSYYKTFVPSDTLIGVVHLQTRLRVQLDPARIWKQAEGGWRKRLSHISTRTTIDVQEKTRDPRPGRVYLLDLSRFRDPVHTLSGRLRVAQDVLLFKRQPRYGLDLSFNQLRGLNQMSADEERRYYRSWRAEGRFKPGTRWGVRMLTSAEQNRVSSSRFSSRRYDISSVRLEPEITIHASKGMQYQFGLAFASKTDALRDQRARLFRIPIEARLSRIGRLQLTARAEIANVSLAVQDENLAGMARFELTDGRGPGTSYLWSLGGRYNVSRFLRATFSYDGRAPADAPLIHTVRMEMTALF